MHQLLIVGRLRAGVSARLLDVLISRPECAKIISEREMFATQYHVAKDSRYVINVNTGQVGKTPIMVMLDRGA